MKVEPSPWTNWAKTSWPNVVVPNHHSESGGTPSGPTKAFGSPGRRKGADEGEGQDHGQDRSTR